MALSPRQIAIVKAIVFALALEPLGANPAEYITRHTGNWALRFLLITLSVTPLRRLGAQRWLSLHRLVYLIASLDVLHFWRMVTLDITQPAIFAVLLAILLGYRVVAKLRAPGKLPV